MKAKESAKRIELKQQKKEQEGLKDCTFQPTLAPIPNHIKQKTEQSDAKRYELLYQKGKARKKGVTTEEKEAKACTFKPKMLTAGKYVEMGRSYWRLRRDCIGDSIATL
jgi:hypothetical protein